MGGIYSHMMICIKKYNAALIKHLTWLPSDALRSEADIFGTISPDVECFHFSSTAIFLCLEEHKPELKICCLKHAVKDWIIFLASNKPHLDS